MGIIQSTSSVSEIKDDELSIKKPTLLTQKIHINFLSELYLSQKTCPKLRKNKILEGNFKDIKTSNGPKFQDLSIFQVKHKKNHIIKDKYKHSKKRKKIKKEMATKSITRASKDSNKSFPKKHINKDQFKYANNEVLTPGNLSIKLNKTRQYKNKREKKLITQSIKQNNRDKKQSITPKLNARKRNSIEINLESNNNTKIQKKINIENENIQFIEASCSTSPSTPNVASNISSNIQNSSSPKNNENNISTFIIEKSNEQPSIHINNLSFEFNKISPKTRSPTSELNKLSNSFSKSTPSATSLYRKMWPSWKYYIPKRLNKGINDEITKSSYIKFPFSNRYRNPYVYDGITKIACLRMLHLSIMILGKAEGSTAQDIIEMTIKQFKHEETSNFRNYLFKMLQEFVHSGFIRSLRRGTYSLGNTRYLKFSNVLRALALADHNTISRTQKILNVKGGRTIEEEKVVKKRLSTRNRKRTARFSEKNLKYFQSDLEEEKKLNTNLLQNIPFKQIKFQDEGSVFNESNFVPEEEKCQLGYFSINKKIAGSPQRKLLDYTDLAIYDNEVFINGINESEIKRKYEKEKFESEN